MALTAHPPDLMQAMTIETIAGKRFDTLSGGQKRRVSLVTGLLGRPANRLPR